MPFEMWICEYIIKKYGNPLFEGLHEIRETLIEDTGDEVECTRDVHIGAFSTEGLKKIKDAIELYLKENKL